MIKITAENKGSKTDLGIKIDGTGEDIVVEAVTIMCQLPKQIKEISTPVLLRFLAELSETDMFGVAMNSMKEADDDDQQMES
jgi:hypothetical protein